MINGYDGAALIVLALVLKPFIDGTISSSILNCLYLPYVLYLYGMHDLNIMPEIVQIVYRFIFSTSPKRVALGGIWLLLVFRGQIILGG